MIVWKPNGLDLWRVFANLRPVDAREAAMTRFNASADAMVEDMRAADAIALSVLALGVPSPMPDHPRPLAILAAHLAAPGVATVSMVARDDWPRIAWAASRFMAREWFPRVIDPAVRRAECRVWSGHVEARKWLGWLGFKEEGVCRRFGAGGEDFIHCARLTPLYSRGEKPCASAA